MSNERLLKPARQPFTIPGVARFAHASMGRVLGSALVFGLGAGMVVSWLGTARWGPVLDEAAAALPATGGIEQGVLRWPERTGRLLAANQFLSFEVVLDAFRTESTPVDLAFEWQADRLVLRTVFGSGAVLYPRNWRIELNRTALGPRWGAWKAPILFGLIPVTALTLLITWSLLAVPYSLVALAVGKLFGRDLTFRSAWKLALAAELFGCVIISFGLALYAAGQISPVFVAVMFVAHFLPTLGYLLLSPLWVPKQVAPLEKNPFDPDRKISTVAKNPFSGGKH